ncbi:MAG: PPC domain-containing protein, partial [Anaerolineae bacterium]
ARQKIIQVELDHPHATYPVSILDSHGLTLADGVFTGQRHRVIASYAAFADATLYILVHAGNSPSNPKDPYQLKVLTFDCPDIYEPNGSFTLASPMGAGNRLTVQSYLCRAWDKDYFWFRANAGQRIDVELGGYTSDYEVTLYDPWQAKVDTSSSHIAHDAPVSGDYFLRVQSRSGWRYSASSPYDLTVSLGPKPSLLEADFRLLDMEVTQVIQDLDNDVPLITGKPTYARLYVSCRRCTLNVQGHLSANLDGVELSPPQVLCTGRTTAYDIAQVSARERGDWRRTVNCLLPTTWLESPGMLEVTGYVYDTKHDDPRVNDNTMSVSLRVDESPPLHLKIVQVRDGCDENKCTEADGPSPKDYAAIDRLMERMYPVREVDFIFHQGASVPWDGEGPTLDSLHALHATHGTQPNTFIMGVLRGHVLLGKRGLGERGTDADGNGVASWVEIVGKDSQFLAAHELGHNLRLNHVDCCWWNRPDSPYDHYDGEPYIGSGDVREIYGLDVGTNPPTVVKPRDRHEIMTYAGGDAWIAKPHYRTLDRALREGAGMTTTVQAAHTFSQTYLIISGSIYTETDDVRLMPIRRIDGAELNPYTSTNGPGDHMLRLVDGTGSTLYEQSFGLVAGHDEAAGSPLFLIVPDQVGLQRLEVLHGGTVLYAVDATPSAPDLTLHPVAGILPEELVVSWTAYDADEDALSADVSLSQDGGTTWQPLTVGVAGSQSAFDTSLWPETGQGMLRVQVSDGFNTAMDVTGPFTITGKAPVVYITAAANGDIFAPGWPALFSANGFDAEDGSLSGEALEWTSNRDDELGVGSQVIATDLSLGWHEITVTATDSDDNTATDSIQVYVGYQVYLPTLLRQHEQVGR